MGSLKLDQQLVMNKYAIVAVQSTNKEQAQQNKEAEVPQIPRQRVQPYFFPRNCQQVPAQKVLHDAKSEGLLQTVKENRQRRKPKEKKEQQKKKTPNRTKRQKTIQNLQRQRRRRRKQKMAKLHQLKKKLLKD